MRRINKRKPGPAKLDAHRKSPRLPQYFGLLESYLDRLIKRRRN